jgi:ubiquinone/menaquinone biosynthesis C-methylase UbiE
MTGDKEDIMNQFGRVSGAYASSPDFASGGDLDILLNMVQPNPSMVLLDVATGAGHTAIKMAPHVKHVTAVDITSEMIDHTRKLATSKNLTNVTALLMDAESLSFSDGLFDVVTCRFAPHHFGDVQKFLSEIYRVLKPGGIFVLEDVSSPLDKEQDMFINKINKIRDPTHVRSYNPSEWKEMIKNSGLQIQSVQDFRRRYNLETWLDRAGASDDAKALVRRMCYDTSKIILRHFEIPDMEPLSFTEDNVIILSKKNV